MIFFRERRVLVHFQKSPDLKVRGFFVRMRADFHGPIHPESGMVLNLKDVDPVLQKNFQSDFAYQNPRDFLKSQWKDLKVYFPQHLKALSLTYKVQTWIYDGHTFNYHYKISSHFQEGRSLISRSIVLESSKPMKASRIKVLRGQIWGSIHEFLANFKSLKDTVSHVHIERPEWRGWEKWGID